MKPEDFKKIADMVANHGVNLTMINEPQAPDEKLEYHITVFINSKDPKVRNSVQEDLNMLELDSFPHNPYYITVKSSGPHACSHCGYTGKMNDLSINLNALGFHVKAETQQTQVRSIILSQCPRCKMNDSLKIRHRRGD